MSKAPDQKGSPAGEPILRVAGVRKSLGGKVMLSGVNLLVNRGETVAIIGPSGAGKTTLLRCINFLTPYDEGRIYIDGELVGYREEGGRLRLESDANISRVRRKTGMVFQRFALFPHRTVLQNVIEGPVHVLKHSPRQAIERAMQLLNAVGLLDKGTSLASVIGVTELMRTAQNVASATFLNLEAYLLAGAFYVVTVSLLQIGASMLEARMTRANGRI